MAAHISTRMQRVALPLLCPCLLGHLLQGVSSSMIMQPCFACCASWHVPSALRPFMACSAGAARLCTHRAPREARVASHTWPDATARPAAAHMRTPYRPRPRPVLPAPAEISLNLLYEPYSLNLFSEPLAHVSSRSFPVGGTGFEFRCLEYGRRVTHMYADPHPIVERL